MINGIGLDHYDHFPGLKDAREESSCELFRFPRGQCIVGLMRPAGGIVGERPSKTATVRLRKDTPMSPYVLHSVVRSADVSTDDVMIALVPESCHPAVRVCPNSYALKRLISLPIIGSNATWCDSKSCVGQSPIDPVSVAVVKACGCDHETAPRGDLNEVYPLPS